MNIGNVVSPLSLVTLGRQYSVTYQHQLCSYVVMCDYRHTSLKDNWAVLQLSVSKACESIKENKCVTCISKFLPDALV